MLLSKCLFINHAQHRWFSALHTFTKETVKKTRNPPGTSADGSQISLWRILATATSPLALGMSNECPRSWQKISHPLQSLSHSLSLHLRQISCTIKWAQIQTCLYEDVVIASYLYHLAITKTQISNLSILSFYRPLNISMSSICTTGFRGQCTFKIKRKVSIAGSSLTSCWIRLDY